MAVTNEVLVGRYNGILVKLLAMKEGAPAPSLMPEILAGIILENDRPEFKYLGGTQLGCAAADVGGVALNLSTVEILNPIGSDLLVVVEDITLSSDVSFPFSIGLGRLGAPLFGAPNFSTSRDTRQGIIQIATQVTSGNQLTAGATLGRQIILGGILARTNYTFKIDYVLAPGDCLLCVNLDSNSQLKASCRWYERHLDPAEIR